eukprot:TRINITY_DN64506_c0_g1_i1.p1 TRINITY_DN64506_c0_g1~~TRINITY_DN64506_c0_g1_i1.p1  ORF type:complete len:315 (+),score=51.80 TRINITY_DN64506_c0_g1_i1:65-946(+)
MVNTSFIYKGLPPPGILCACYLGTAVALLVHNYWWGVLFFWPATLYGLVTYAYLRDGTFGANLLQKRAASTGGLPLYCVVAFFPYLVTTWLIWFIRHTFVHFHEDCYNVIAPGVYLGRFPVRLPCRRPKGVRSGGKDCDAGNGTASAILDLGFPKDAQAVVDLCAEFPALPWVVEQVRGRYFCLPCLDGDMPEDKEALLRMASEVAQLSPDVPVYIHCANGRGRSCCFAALVLLLRPGGPRNVEEAFAQIRAARPQVRVARAQRQLVEATVNATVEVEMSSDVNHRLVGKPRQ